MRAVYRVGEGLEWFISGLAVRLLSSVLVAVKYDFFSFVVIPAVRLCVVLFF